MNERRFWIGLLLLVGVALAVPPDMGNLAAPARLVLADSSQEPAKAPIDIELGESNRGATWYENPVFVGVGVIALVLLVVAARRDRSTTVVDNRVRNRRSSR